MSPGAGIDRLEQKVRDLVKRYCEITDERNRLEARLREREQDLARLDGEAADLRKMKRGVHERVDRMITELDRIHSGKSRAKA